jgi:hypothetical protein
MKDLHAYQICGTISLSAAAMTGNLWLYTLSAAWAISCLFYSERK